MIVEEQILLSTARTGLPERRSRASVGLGGDWRMHRDLRCEDPDISSSELPPPNETMVL